MKLTQQQMLQLRLNQPQLSSDEVIQQARRNWANLIERGLAPSNENASSNGPKPKDSPPLSVLDPQTITIACWDLKEA